MQNIKHHRLAVSPSPGICEYAEGLLVNREEGSKELWVLVR